MNRAARRAAARADKRDTIARARSATLDAAIARHRSGDLPAAERLYERLLEASPRDADALHFLGVLRHARGRVDEGLELVQRAVAIVPHYVDAWSNLGNLYKLSEKLPEAEEAFHHALALDEGHAAAWNNLGVVLHARGRLAEAAGAFRRATAIRSAFADAHFNLGNALRDCGLVAECIAAYREAVTFAPTHSRAHHRLGSMLYITGAKDEATTVFRNWLAADPSNVIAAHMIAALTGENVPERASDAYVSSIFDGFASDFDEVLLHRLDYRAPALIEACLASVLGAREATRDVLDAGCGTGLCGPLLAPYAETLTGVDLSAGMLEKARALDVYDRLSQDEITRVLAREPEAFDVIASADTLCYFGNLETVARAARAALRAGGWLAFTVERVDDATAYRINPHGRYSHSRSYVEGILVDAGFTAIDIAPVVLRMELGTPVQGWMVRARSPDKAVSSARAPVSTS